MNVEVNYLAVILAALSTMVVGSTWYSMKVFGKWWCKWAKVDMSRKVKPSEMVYMMGGTLLVSLITAYVLAHFSFLAYQFYLQDYSFLATCLITAVWAWLGFTAARIFTHDAFEGRRKKLTLLNASHELVTFLVMGLVIGLFGI